MKKLLLAAASGWTLLGLAAVSAQGLPPGAVPPHYGSQAWFAAPQPSHGQNVRGSDRRAPVADQAAVPGTAEPTVNSLSAMRAGG